MNEDKFNELAAQGYNYIPFVLETFADLDTPLSIYLKLANQPFSYLLESVLGGERFGRYSVVGLPARTRLEVFNQQINVINGTEKEIHQVTNVLGFIESYLANYKIAPNDDFDLPRFYGGLVGYFGYDTIRYIEPKLSHCAKPDTLNTPDILLLLSEELVVIDNLAGKIYLIVFINPNTDRAYQTGKERIKVLLQQLRQPITVPFESPHSPGTATSEFSESAFIQAIERAKQYIVDGDIMQVVLSQRTSLPYAASRLPCTGHYAA